MKDNKELEVDRNDPSLWSHGRSMIMLLGEWISTMQNTISRLYSCFETINGICRMTLAIVPLKSTRVVLDMDIFPLGICMRHKAKIKIIFAPAFGSTRTWVTSKLPTTGLSPRHHSGAFNMKSSLEKYIRLLVCWGCTTNCGFSETWHTMQKCATWFISSRDRQFSKIQAGSRDLFGRKKS